MYKNIGEKIKKLAAYISSLGVSWSIVLGIFLTYILSNSSATKSFAFAGIIIGVIGALLSYILNLALYGFGELIVQTTKTNTILSDLQNSTDKNQKLEVLKQWKDKGLITENEYLNKIKSL